MEFQNKKPADKEELLLVLNEDGTPTGRLEKRSVVHKNNLWHREVSLWNIDTKNGKILLQRRSKNKSVNPGKLAICAGHIVGLDSIEDTLKTEVKEEMGLNLADFKLHQMEVLKKDDEGNHHFTYQFYTDAYIPLEKIKIQEEELSEVLYMDYKKFRERIKNGDTEFVFNWQKHKGVFEVFDKLFDKSKK